MIERLLTLDARGRWLSLSMLVLVSVAAALQLPNLHIDRSDERLVGADDPGWASLRLQERHFGTEQSVIVYLRADELWTSDLLKALQEVTFALEDTPGITSVESLLSVTNIRDKGNFVDAGPLVDIVPTDAVALNALRDDALYSPLIRRNYISDDGNATAINIGYAPNAEDPAHELKIHALIESKISPLRAHFAQVFQLGWPRLNAEVDRGLTRDLKLLIPLSVFILIATVTYFLRSPQVVPIPLVTAGLTILWTLGFMAFMELPITLLTAILPALIIVVGSVEDVHLIAGYFEGLKPELTAFRRQAVLAMAKHVGPAILITSITTILGFVSNVTSAIPLIQEFAIAAAFAMAANFVVTVFA
ncbi:MAG: MMPL family transporter, partial [Gammaproteobacteria bacterium]